MDCCVSVTDHREGQQSGMQNINFKVVIFGFGDSYRGVVVPSFAGVPAGTILIEMPIRAVTVYRVGLAKK